MSLNIGADGAFACGTGGTTPTPAGGYGSIGIWPDDSNGAVASGPVGWLVITVLYIGALPAGGSVSNIGTDPITTGMLIVGSL